MQLQESCILFYVHGVIISSRAAVTEVFAVKVSPVISPSPARDRGPCLHPHRQLSWNLS